MLQLTLASCAAHVKRDTGRKKHTQHTGVDELTLHTGILQLTTGAVLSVQSTT